MNYLYSVLEKYSRQQQKIDFVLIVLIQSALSEKNQIFLLFKLNQFNLKTPEISTLTEIPFWGRSYKSMPDNVFQFFGGNKSNISAQLTRRFRNMKYKDCVCIRCFTQ